MSSRDDEIERIINGRQSEPTHVKSNISLPDLPDTDDIKELCKASQKTVFQTYHELMTDEAVPPTVRLAAANAISNRGLGKPEQAAAEAVKVERPETSLDDVARMLAFSMRDARERGTLPPKTVGEKDDG